MTPAPTTPAAPTKTGRCVGEFLSSDYVEEQAREILPTAIFEFISGGADNEITLAANCDGFRSYRLRPRVLVDVSDVDTSITLFGRRLRTPLLVAPMGSHQLTAPHGELATAKAASSTGVKYITSTAASYSLEQVAQIDGLDKWFQLYCFKDRSVTSDLIERAEAAGYEALVITVDAPVLGMRRRDLRNEFMPGPHIRWANLERYGRAGLPENTTGATVLDYFVDQIDATVTWDDVGWMKSRTSLPVILKGVLTAEDARRLVDLGLDGVYVSNHGGRQLDQAIGTIEALPAVIEAVPADTPVIIDGGIRSAGDILVALALGASAVSIGRPILYALGIGGETAVREYLRQLLDDLQRAMALTGIPSLDQIDMTHIVRL